MFAGLYAKEARKYGVIRKTFQSPLRDYKKICVLPTGVTEICTKKETFPMDMGNASEYLCRGIGQKTNGRPGLATNKG